MNIKLRLASMRMDSVLWYSFFRPISGLIVASFSSFFNYADFGFSYSFFTPLQVFVFAGLDNELFYLDKTMMVFGDAKKVVEDMVKAVE